ncbi:membrane protein [Photobacterium angustum]|uniref:OmpA family protein n=1 Tax=Photobacterium angustum TaxID=661 RepID=A0ABX5GXV1_PHOAN|nr:OmpA family protein [Photobacterium angustum]KJG35114.1 membrane protein [Photobacterium angustum]PSX01474.1 OmpA family protein [Photobacterium angustum]
MRAPLLLLVAFFLLLTGCSSFWPAPGETPLPPPKQAQLRQLELHQFELQLLAIRGAKHCLPGQYIKLQNLYLQARKEALSGFDHDAEMTLLKYQTHNAVIQQQMDWLEYNTLCLQPNYSEVELKERFLLYMEVDNQFALNKSTLLPKYRESLRYAAEILKRQSHWHLQLTGYTDSQGHIQGNYMLGLERANAVKDSLIENGVDPNQIIVFSVGENQAVADNTLTQQLNNRKVEARVLVEHHAQSIHRVFNIKDWHAIRDGL